MTRGEAWLLPTILANNRLGRGEAWPEPTVPANNRQGRVAHAWLSPTIVSQQSSLGSVATRVAEANNRAANNLPLFNFKLNESVSQ